MVTSAFFQNRGYGDIYIDDLIVTMKVKPLITLVSQPASRSIGLEFNAGETDLPSDFAVEQAASADGGFQNIATPVTALGSGNFRVQVPAADGQGFFRIKHAPLAF